MRFVSLGAPGVGKGTYTDILAREYNLPRISTGDLLREQISKKTKLGERAKSYYDKGDLVPDDLTTQILKQRLKKEDCKNGFFIDGYPRNLNQARLLENITKIDKVLNFVASDATIIDRLSGRRLCKNCGEVYHIKNVPPKKPGVCDKCGGELYQRDDDKPGAIKQRLLVYSEQTAPLVNHYKKKGLLLDVDVTSPYEERFKVIEKIKKTLG